MEAGIDREQIQALKAALSKACQDPAKLKRLVSDQIDQEQWVMVGADIKGDATREDAMRQTIRWGLRSTTLSTSRNGSRCGMAR